MIEGWFWSYIPETGDIWYLTGENTAQVYAEEFPERIVFQAHKWEVFPR